MSIQLPSTQTNTPDFLLGVERGHFVLVPFAAGQPNDRAEIGFSAPPISISANTTIDITNYRQYNGQVLEWTGAFTVTISAGLPNFGFMGIPPASGNASVAASGVLLNGAGTTITKAAADISFGVFQRLAANSYLVK